VASEAQDRMLSVIKDLSYTPNLAAHSVRSHAKNLVGLIMQGVNRAIAEFKFYPLIYTTDDVRRSGRSYESAHRAAE
jgi:DNA-binding LacI/PurR family transcriptional regulator